MPETRARRFDRAWRLIVEDGGLTKTLARLSVHDLRSLINRVLDAVADQDAADLENEALEAADRADWREEE